MADNRMTELMLQAVTHAETGKGKKYMRLTLLEKGGRLWPGMCWDDKPYESGTIVSAVVEETEYQGTAQLTVQYMKPIKGNPEDFLPKTPYSIDGLQNELGLFINEVQDPHLKNILETIYNDPRWRRAPAAQKLHHAYLGGLLEHTVCLMRLAKAVADLYPKDLRRDYLYTITMLHDIGKMDEISNSLNMEYTTPGELIGHVGLGLFRVARLMDAYPDPKAFGTLEEPTDRRLLVLHGIAAHHGSLNYGALKTPATIEAQVLSDIDGLDAHIAKIRAVIDRTPADKIWSDKVKWDEPKVYLGGRPKEEKP